MQLKPGWTYKFSFLPGFDTLDGVYTVMKIYTYDEMLADGVTLYDGLYSHVGKTEQNVNDDVTSMNFRDEDVYKLTHPEDSEIVYYVPYGVLAIAPDPNVAAYPKLVLAFNVGVATSEEELSGISANINEVISKMFGIPDAAKVFSIGNEWLTEDEYATIVANRDTSAKAVVSYFADNVQLRNDLEKRNARIAALEAYIKKIAEKTP